METEIFIKGNYRFIRGPFQYSGGVSAEPGYCIERTKFRKPLPINIGFKSIADYLIGIGRPLTALCACELRSPAPFTEKGFNDFNRNYVETLASWEILHNDENPVARSNVCPEVDPPLEPCFEAFSYTVPDVKNKTSFVISGSAEAPEGFGGYGERIIRLGDQSENAMHEKAKYVLSVMESRMAALEKKWSDATVTQSYTVYNLYPFLADEIISRGAAKSGLTWHYARPPVEGLDFEMDVRGVSTEKVI